MTRARTGADPEFLTVRELAELLRIKERKVYDLAATGSVPCSRATGKLLFPAAEVRAWIAGASTGGTPDIGPRPPAILLGSHDPLLDWAIRESRCGLATFFDGSHDGLARFRAGEGVATGLHVHDAASGDWNLPVVAESCGDRNAALISFATRRRGIVVRTGNGTIKGIADLAGHRVTPRQPESGTETLFHHLLARHGVSAGDITFGDVARTETDAVQSVARGTADAAFGLECVARDFGLDFLPLVNERFDLLVDRAAWFDPPLQALERFCRAPAFAKRAEMTGGYDLGGHGKVRWNA
ncbi:MAG: helix-turn-helix transcriptional regulator [Roseovarius sp.]|nr:helix-turn-helix transcriptional regulator [Roseovarius sp.]